MKLILIGGKANSGKDTTAEIVDEIYRNKGLDVVNIQIGFYMKMYAKQIAKWDGDNESKPRELLQELGTEVIRKQIDEYFFINRILQDIDVYSRYFDVITISDVRLPLEYDCIKKKYKEAIAVHVTRPGYVSHLTKKQKEHITETLIDGYNGYDYEIVNDGTLEDLEKKIKKFIKEVDKNEKND